MTGDFVLPESVTELGNFIVSGSAFNGKLDIKANIEEIPAYAFKDTKFTSLALPNSLKKIGEQAFYGCASLTSSITFGNKLEIVDKYAFSKSGIAGALVFPTSFFIKENRYFCICRMSEYYRNHITRGKCNN